jgi:hypothetical protein
MTGGQGCGSQCTHPPNATKANDTGHCSFDVPMHCPRQTDSEYRTEASIYAIVSSPMMVGTDIRELTSIMKELLLNPESIALNQVRYPHCLLVTVPCPLCAGYWLIGAAAAAARIIMLHQATRSLAAARQMRRLCAPWRYSWVQHAATAPLQ